MLVDPKTNELYLRAEKGLGEKQARGFNVKIEDSLIGSVVRTGKPVVMARGASQDARLKVVTGYLVNALLYVPLAVRGHIIGGGQSELPQGLFRARTALDERPGRLCRAGH